jgi:hypothetical protein
MKPAQLGSLNTDLAPIEEDLAVRVGAIFDRCPQLFGFTVQDSSALPEELRAIALERELVVSDIGVYPYLNADQCEQIYNEIAVALLDFMFERPAAKDVLRGRTFVLCFQHLRAGFAVLPIAETDGVVILQDLVRAETLVPRKR